VGSSPTSGSHSVLSLIEVTRTEFYRSMNRNKYSRLSKRLEKQSQKNLILSALGILVVIFLLVKFGIPLLVNFSVFIGSLGKADETVKTETESFVTAPILDIPFTATNSAQTRITGQSTAESTVSVYLNGSLFEKNEVEKDGIFSFLITLNDGENRIKAKAEKDNKESDFSDELIIIYQNKPPSLEIKSPTEGQKFEKDQNTVIVTGKTDSGTRVTVNSFWAQIDEENNFSYNLTLHDGDNEIKIIAEDKAGNKTEKNIKVNYSP